MVRPFSMCSRLDDYKYDVVEFGKDLEKFHCCEDNSYIKKKVFEIIEENLLEIRIDSLIIRKCKTGPALRVEEKFYSTMLGYLLRYIMEPIDFQIVEEVCVITDSLPTKRKKSAFKKAIKTRLSKSISNTASYRIYHHSSAAHYGLQIADYCNWAIMRKWERGDDEYYSRIKSAITSEFEIFRNGRVKYYDDGRAI